MKEYRVFIDITIATAVDVKANDEQEAKELAMEKYWSDTRYYETNGGLVDASVVDWDEL